MFIIVKRRGVESARIKIERLVSTLGFGEDCDVSLDIEREDQKLGMLIQQGEGLSFRPLKQELRFFLGDIPVDNMMPLAEGEWLSMDDFELSWVAQAQEFDPEPSASQLPPPPKPIAAPILPNRAGALMAYGQTGPSTPNPTTNKSEESLELSSESPPPVKEEKTIAPPPEPVSVLSESKESEPSPAKPTPPEQNLSPAEIELVEKLKRLETVKKPSPSNEVTADDEPQKKKGWKESENDILGPAWKRVVKYFYHHIESDVFLKSQDDKKAYMNYAIQLALDATTPPQEHEVVRPRVERELESASPFDRVGLSSDVQGMRVTDKGLLSMDRGQGFGAPEMSFYNGAHVCWSFDRWLQSHDVERKFYGTDCQAINIGLWTVHAFFEPMLTSGFLIQFQKTPKALGVSLDWSTDSDYDFKSIRDQRQNLLFVSQDQTQMMRQFQLIQSDLCEGKVLGVIGERLKVIKDETKLMFLDSDQSLSQILKVADAVGTCGLVDFELESRGKSLFQQIAFKNLAYFGFTQARQPLDALRRFELQWRLTNPQSDTQAVREWILASFPYLAYIDKKKGEEKCFISAVSLKNGEWQVSNPLIDDWE